MKYLLLTIAIVYLCHATENPMGIKPFTANISYKSGNSNFTAKYFFDPNTLNQKYLSSDDSSLIIDDVGYVFVPNSDKCVMRSRSYVTWKGDFVKKEGACGENKEGQLWTLMDSFPNTFCIVDHHPVWISNSVLRLDFEDVQVFEKPDEDWFRIPEQCDGIPYCGSINNQNICNSHWGCSFCVKYHACMNNPQDCTW